MFLGSFDFNNAQILREAIKKSIHSRDHKNFTKIKESVFFEEDILLKPIDYYYTNSIARASKVMSECRKVSKNLLYTEFKKAN